MSVDFFYPATGNALRVPPVGITLGEFIKLRARKVGIRKVESLIAEAGKAKETVYAILRAGTPDDVANRQLDTRESVAEAVKFSGWAELVEAWRADDLDRGLTTSRRAVEVGELRIPFNYPGDFVAAVKPLIRWALQNPDAAWQLIGEKKGAGAVMIQEGGAVEPTPPPPPENVGDRGAGRSNGAPPGPKRR